MVGSALCRLLTQQQDVSLITRSRGDLDLMKLDQVDAFFNQNSIDVVYLAAAKVGGIHANRTYPVSFLHNNLLIQSHVIHSAFKHGVKQLLFLGSSCIYPKEAPQPIPESALLSGLLEPTNEPYAVAKIAGIKLCESLNREYGDSHGVDYRSIMPTNLYGPGDNYHPDNAHVMPALLRRIHEAKQNNQSSVTVWGTGNPIREFLHADDLARACVHLMSVRKEDLEKAILPQCSHVNAGSGMEVSVVELAKLICQVVGFKGEVQFDPSKPDGTPRKRLDSSLLNRLGWKPEISLEEGVRTTYRDFKNLHTSHRP
jgi:GDP-L-fucose synthase